MDSRRIVEIWTSAGKAGTGYLVADRLVLTAFHNVAEGAVEVRPFGAAAWVPAELAWPEQRPDLTAHPDADAALLRVTDRSWRPPDGLTPVRWGRVSGDDRVPCLAVGFPEAQTRGGIRDTKEIRGHVERLTGLKSRLITVNVDRSAVPSDFRDGSGWAGASGAALFCDNRLVGVLTTDRVAYAASQLVAVPVTGLVARPGFHAVTTGAGAAVTLEDVSAAGTFTPAALRSPGDVDSHEGITNLPDVPSSVFVGRQSAFAALDAALTEGTTAITQTLSGLGGVGKSTLALHYARSRRRQYRLVWWISAETPEQIASGLAALTARVHGIVPGLTTTVLAEWAIGWLQSHPGWLIVLDNAERPADVHALSGQLSHAGRLLITTRYRAGWSAAPIELPPLDTESSLAVLSGWTGQAGDAATTALVSELGNLPLALEQAGAYIAQTHISSADYLAQLRSHPDTMIDTPPEGGAHQRTVGRIWAVTMATIADRNPLAAHILHVVAWFAPDGVPRDLLSPMGEGTDVQRALALLSAYSMITLDAETVSVHRLVQAVARTVSATDPHRTTEAVERYRLLAAELLDQALPEGDPNVPHFPAETWPRWRALLPHIHAHVALVDPGQDTATTAHILFITASFLLCQAQVRDAASYHERALEARERLLGPDHPDTFRSRNGLGHTHQWVNVERAAELHERNLRDRMRVLGPDHFDTLISSHNLGNTYVTLDRAEEAIELLARTWSARERVLGPGHPFTLGSFHCLGHAYRAHGDFPRATEILKQVAEDRERALGPDHFDTVDSLVDLAMVYQEAGNAEQAIELYRRAVAESVRVLGTDHPDTLLRRRRLGYAHIAGGSPDTAVGLLRTALAEHERVFGTEHAHTLWARHDLADAYRAVGDPEAAKALLDHNLVELQRTIEVDDRETLEARTELAFAYSDAKPTDEVTFELLEHVLATYESMSGPDSPNTARARNNLALAHESTGAAERAVPLYEAAVDTYERIMGPEHPLTVNTRARLAGALSTSDPQRAIGVYEIVVRDRERTLGPDHPDTLNARENLGNATILARYFPSGLAILLQLLADRRRIAGDSDDKVLTTASNLGLAYCEAGEFTQAIELLSRTLADCERILGPEHEAALASRHNLALAYQESGDRGVAIELLERNIPACERVLGPNHPDTVMGRRNLATAYDLDGQLNLAAELYGRVVADLEWAFGPDHPETVKARNSQAWMLLNSGEAARAVPLFELCLAARERNLGAEHPDTQAMRDNLALAHERARSGGDTRKKLRHLVERAVPNRRQRGR